MTKGKWVNQTIEEFCVEKILEGQEETTCYRCKEVTPFWVDEFGGILCIECAHAVYSDYVYEMYVQQEEYLDACFEANDG